MRHLVCTDLHGNGVLWGKIKEKLNKDDVLYFLGDAADRGPDGLLIMLDMLNDARVVYIKGNHEQFAEDFLKEARFVEYWEDIPRNAINLWESNGGSKTMNDIWFDLTKDEAKKLYLQLKSLPHNVKIIVNGTLFLLSHAGYTPHHLTKDLEHDKDILLWNREHFTDAWQENEDGGNVIVLHGHTPTGFLKLFAKDMVWFDRNAYFIDEETKKFEPFIYADGHKIDLDLCSAFSNRAALYCLETQSWEIIDVNID